MASVQDIYNEITRIDNAKQGIAEAIEEKGVQVPEESRIVEYPGLVRQIQTGSPDAVLYTPQELTPEQQEQARTNIGATAPEVFWATYGTTTAAEIDAAVAAGKVVMCIDGVNIFPMVSYDTTYYYFSFILNGGSYRRQLKRSDSSWARGTTTLQLVSNKVQTLTGNETNEIYYPSTKAVADALGKMGVVSQTQTWTGSGSTPQTYVMSDLVRGLIPKSFIELVQSAGVVFNETTGYFEYAGLTDISYEEMNKIWSLTQPFIVFRPDATYSFYSYAVRTIITPIGVRTGGTGINFGWGMYNSRVESIDFHNLPISSLSQGFRACAKLKNAYGVNCLGVANDSNLSNFVLAAWRLEYIELMNIKVNVVMSDCSALNLASVVYLVNNAVNTTAITITLHATAYARCQADTTEYTYNGQTYTGIIAYAAAKNITIQSA